VLAPLGLLALSIFSSAVYRVCLRPSESRWGFLRVGADEARIALLTVIFTGLWALYLFAVTLIGGVLSAAVASLGSQASLLFAAIFIVGVLCLTVFLAVRLSLAAPQTFAERRISIFDSWALTRGHFWKMLGAYALAFALVLIVWLLSAFITQGLLVALHGGNLVAARSAGTNMSTLAAYFTPQTVIVLAFNALLNALFYGLQFSPGTVIYQELVQSAGGGRAAKAFT
jgi:hypothetical protein